MRFMVQAPIGFHMDICSQTSFVFGEEDVVLQHVTKVNVKITSFFVWIVPTKIGDHVMHFMVPTGDVLNI